MVGVKRKAMEFSEDQSERPALVKRRTFTYGVLPSTVANDSSQQHFNSPECDGHDSAGYMNTFSSSPAFESFQSKITAFCERYGPSFGSAYVTQLQQSHSEVISSHDARSIFIAGQRFMETMNEYMQDLQQAALQQIQLRAQIVKLGTGKETVAAIDVVLSQMDRRIVEIGTEMSELWQELSGLESQWKSHLGGAAFLQHTPPFTSEIAAF